MGEEGTKRGITNKDQCYFLYATFDIRLSDYVVVVVV